jgi:hypothetical protein
MEEAYNFKKTVFSWEKYKLWLKHFLNMELQLDFSFAE